jgi:hypothetical protein
VQEQRGSGGHVRVSGAGAFPLERPVVNGIAGADASPVEELPNEGGAFGAVVVEGLVRPFPGDEDAAAGDAEVFRLVRPALALPRCHR